MSSSKTTEPREGLYRLCVRIKNPQGDKRHIHNYWRREFWEEGDLLVIERDFAVRPVRLLIRHVRDTRAVGIDRNEQAQLLLPHLSRLDEIESVEQFATWLLRCHGLGVDALAAAAVRCGVSLAELRDDIVAELDRRELVAIGKERAREKREC